MCLPTDYLRGISELSKDKTVISIIISMYVLPVPCNKDFFFFFHLFYITYLLKQEKKTSILIHITPLVLTYLAIIEFLFLNSDI